MFRQVSIFVLLFCFIFSFRSYSQAERDTVFYEIQPSQIEEARITESKMGEETNYRIFVQLKQEYHAEFGKLTGNNIDNVLALTHDGKVISPSLPVILAKISRGGINFGSFENKEKAKKVLQEITAEK